MIGFASHFAPFLTVSSSSSGPILSMWVDGQDVEKFLAWAVEHLVREVTAGNCENELKALHDVRITLVHRSHETGE
ncbi:MAG: hypothetical protein OXF02_03605 [Simkaniaceae bacterium]|nr:hypothetical protein [Simkaniaceae bacterium]